MTNLKLEQFLSDQAAGKRRLGKLNLENGEALDLDLSAGVILDAESTAARSRILNLDLSNAEAPGLIVAQCQTVGEGAVKISNASVPGLDAAGFAGKLIAARTNAPSAKFSEGQFFESVLDGNFPNSDLRDATFEASTLIGDFKASKWVGARLIGPKMIDIRVQGADFTGFDFSQLRARPIRRLQLYLQGACLDETVWDGFEFRDIYVSPATTWRRAILRDCNLRGLRIAGCDMSGADLRGADLRGVDVTGCDWTGALLDRTTRISGAVGLSTVTHDIPELDLFLTITAWGES